jgi:hypothetical protein
MSEEKKPTEKAKESLSRGFNELFRAAESVAGALKRETSKSGGITKAVDDAGREIVRAASNVATFVGEELQTWGKKAQEAVDPNAPHAAAPQGPAGHQPGPQPGVPPVAPTPVQAGGKSVTGEEDWPKTREEYEKKYDSEGDNWPRSREEYIDRFGRPPRKKDGDPGFRIATDK